MEVEEKVVRRVEDQLGASVLLAVKQRHFSASKQTIVPLSGQTQLSRRDSSSSFIGSDSFHFLHLLSINQVEEER